MNHVFLIGRLTADPELRTTQSGKSVCEFSIAVDRPTVDKQTDFIRCKVWDKIADNLVKYKQKGDAVAVCGAVRVDKYRDANGKEKYNTYVLATEVEYIGGTRREAANTEASAETEAENDDEFPF